MKITNTTHIIEHQFTIPISSEVQLSRTVNYYIIERAKLYLVDCGTQDAFPQLVAYLHSINRNITEIAAVFLTHSHPDHIGALKKIQEASACKVYAHTSEVNWIEDIEIQFQQRPVPGFQQMVSGSVKISNPILNEEPLVLEPDLTLNVLHTPGHSRGSVCYYLNQDQVLFSGDAILLPGDLPIYTNARDYIHSIHNIGHVPSTTTVLSANHPPLSGENFATLLTESERYLNQIQQIVLQHQELINTKGAIPFCQQVLSHLGFPIHLTNPLLLASFISHLKQYS